LSFGFLRKGVILDAASGQLLMEEDLQRDSEEGMGSSGRLSGGWKSLVAGFHLESEGMRLL
jgi:hypothetical protein